MTVSSPQAAAASRWLPWAIFGVVAAATLMRGTGVFHYDAEHYWAATTGLIDAAKAVPDGYWDLRGIYTAIVFMPAALLTLIFGDSFAGFAVLLQNSLFFAWFAAFLAPAVLRSWVAVTPVMRWSAAFAVWVTTTWFAPYPLMDVYAAVAIIGALVLLRTRLPLALGLAGVIAGIAINLRPAYLVVAILLAVGALVFAKWKGLLVPAGIAVALVPQMLANAVRGGGWGPLPSGSGDLVALQSGYASYIVRYDTILGAPNARQFYCSPDMARLVADDPPGTAGELALAFLGNLPHSLLFSLQKIAAAIHWPMTTPYALPMRGLDALFGAAILTITIVGIATILFRSTRPRGAESRRNWSETTMIGLLVAGTAITLVSAATEARFSLILVMLGALGTTTLLGQPPTAGWRANRWWIIGTAVVVVLGLVLASTGLDHAAPRGDVTPAICSAT